MVLIRVTGARAVTQGISEPIRFDGSGRELYIRARVRSGATDNDDR
jgi:hypothetical protein